MLSPPNSTTYPSAASYVIATESRAAGVGPDAGCWVHGPLAPNASPGVGREWRAEEWVAPTKALAGAWSAGGAAEPRTGPLPPAGKASIPDARIATRAV